MLAPDDRAVASLLFNEQADAILPSDGTGNLPDLADDATTTLPSVVSGTLTGYGRDFVAGSANAIMAADAGDALALTRGMSVVALLELDVAAQDSYGSDGTIIQRGEGTAGDALSFALRLSIVDAANRTVKVYLEWENTSSSIITDTGALFTWPAGETLIVGAVREVIDGELVCRYHVNDESAAGSASPLDVDSTSGADVWVGGEYNGSTYGRYIDATIDAIEVYSEAISTEEFLLLYKRFSEDQPDCVSAVKSLVPDGAYSTDPDSSIQRELTVNGVGLGVVRAAIRHLKDFYWPSLAWGSMLERWESITQHSPKPGDTLAIRRERIASFLGVVRGFAVEDVKFVLQESLDLDTADIEILEYDNDYSQDFASDPADYIQDAGNGAISVTGGVLRNTSTTADILFDDGPGGGKAPWTIWNLDNEVDAWVSCKITVDAASDSDAMGALVVGNRATNEWLLWGKTDAGAHAYATYINGVLSSWTTVDTVPATPTMYHRIKCLGGGSFELRYGSSAAAADAATPTIIATGISEVNWAGFVSTSISSASVSGTIDMDDFLVHTPNGTQRFSWYAYRNPALAGNPDMVGANLVVQRIKPAHTYAAAITQQSVLCDDTESGCDREPIGA